SIGFLTSDRIPQVPHAKCRVNSTLCPVCSPGVRSLTERMPAIFRGDRLFLLAYELHLLRIVRTPAEAARRGIVRSLFIIAGLVALLGISITPKAGADIWSFGPIDRSTVLTFSGPVSLPGVTLPAGSYLFRFISPINSPDVLQVMSVDGTESYAMLHTIPV